MDLFSLIDEHCTVTIRQDMFDSRDLITARDEATALRDELTEDESSAEDSQDEAKELTAIIEAIDEIESESSADWSYGETYIRENEFEEYARQMAEDIGSVTGNEQWPLNHIDWEAAADELRYDYSAITIDGTDYLFRNC